MTLPDKYGDLRFWDLEPDASGNLYVLERVDKQQDYEPFPGRVRKVDAQGNVSTPVARGKLRDPHRLDIDSQGSLYISEGTLSDPYGYNNLVEGRLLRQDPGGGLTPLQHLGGKEVVALTESGGTLYVAFYVASTEYPFNTYYRLQMRKPDGQWIGLLPGTPFKTITDLVASADGTLYVADAGKEVSGPEGYTDREYSRIYRRNNSGTWSVIAPTGDSLGQVNYPVDLSFDSEGHLVVVDAGNHRVMKFISSETVFYGDLDLNGEVELEDAVLALGKVIGLSLPPTSEQLKRMDVAPKKPDGTFGDSVLDINDIIRILRRIVGIEPASWP